MMSKYNKGDHVKIEVVSEQSGESEWMWLLVESSNDCDRLVFGRLDSEPIAIRCQRRTSRSEWGNFRQVRSGSSHCKGGE